MLTRADTVLLGQGCEQSRSELQSSQVGSGSRRVHPHSLRHSLATAVARGKAGADGHRPARRLLHGSNRSVSREDRAGRPGAVETVSSDLEDASGKIGAVCDDFAYYEGAFSDIYLAAC